MKYCARSYANGRFCNLRGRGCYAAYIVRVRATYAATLLQPAGHLVTASGAGGASAQEYQGPALRACCSQRVLPFYDHPFQFLNILQRQRLAAPRSLGAQLHRMINFIELYDIVRRAPGSWTPPPSGPSGKQYRQSWLRFVRIPVVGNSLAKRWSLHSQSSMPSQPTASSSMRGFSFGHPCWLDLGIGYPEGEVFQASLIQTSRSRLFGGPGSQCRGVHCALRSA